MKKGIALALTILVLLTMASCGGKAEEPAPETTLPAATEAVTPAETTEPTLPAPQEPEWEPGTLRAGYGEVVYRTFAAGTQLKLIGQFKNYYVAEQEDVNLLISREMLRLEGEEPFESWQGFSKAGTEVFDNPYLRGAPTATLDLNTQISVLESSGSWAYIQWDGGKGYVKAEQLSKWRITGGSGGGGGGTNDGTDVPIGSLTSGEGSFRPQVHLLGAYHGPEMDQDFAGGMAFILAEGTEGYLCLLTRGEEVKVTDHNEETVTIWLGDALFAQLPRELVQLAGDGAYEAWDGYCGLNGVLFEECQMVTELEKLATNTQLKVLDEVSGCYVVEYQGRIGYMKPEAVSKDRIVSNPGSGGGSGNSGWTPPKL